MPWLSSSSPSPPPSLTGKSPPLSLQCWLGTTAEAAPGLHAPPCSTISRRGRRDCPSRGFPRTSPHLDRHPRPRPHPRPLPVTLALTLTSPPTPSRRRVVSSTRTWMTGRLRSWRSRTSSTTASRCAATRPRAASARTAAWSRTSDAAAALVGRHGRTAVPPQRGCGDQHACQPLLVFGVISARVVRGPLSAVCVSVCLGLG